MVQEELRQETQVLAVDLGTTHLLTLSRALWSCGPGTAQTGDTGRQVLAVDRGTTHNFQPASPT